MIDSFGNLLIFLGIVVIIVGIVVNFLPISGLPGDILIKRESFTFYFPITTSFALSIFLSLLFFIFAMFFNK